MRFTWLLALGIALALPEGAARAQTLTGIVTDARSGLPLAGANVMVQPGANAPGAGAPGGVAQSDGRVAAAGLGASCDRAGVYSIALPGAGPFTVTFSHVGYESVQRNIGPETRTVRISIALQPVALPGPDIEVSAMRARERVSPVTFSDLNLRKLEERASAQDLPVLLADLPSSTYYSEGGDGIGYNYLRIRGFDQRRLAIMVNGVPQNDPEDHNVYWVDFADIVGSTEEIQVQRGAGSAFYGPPAIGGSINIVTGDFAARRGIRLSSGVGSFLSSGIPVASSSSRSALSIASGLIDQRYALFARISRLGSDGYREQSWVRATSYYLAATRYDERLTTRVNLYGTPIEDGLVYEGLPKFAVADKTLRRRNYNYWEAENGAYTYTQQRRPQEQERFSQPHAELLNEWTPSERVTVNSALFYVTGQGYFDYDGTGWTDAAYYRLTTDYGFPGAANPANPLIRAWVDNRQLGWLPRVAWRHDGGTLTAGLELRRHRSLHWGKLLWAEGLPADLDPDRHYYEYRGGKDIASLYLQEMYQVTDRLNLMGNLQYVFNRYRLSGEKYVGTDFAVDYHFVNPRLGVNLNLSEALNLYANLAWTQREPRLKNLYDAAESSGGALPQFAALPGGGYDYSSPLVRPEKLLNLELGTGITRGSLRLLAGGYLMSFQDEIVKSGQLDRFGQPVTGNAERTLHLGLEASAVWQPLPSLECEVNGMASRSRLQRYSVWETDAGGTAQEITLDGNRIAGFPELLANARVTWRHGGFSASLAGKYIGDQYTDNFQNEEMKVDAAAVLNGSLAWTSPPLLGLRALELRLQVTNLTNNLYAQSGEGKSFFVAAERQAWFEIALEL